MTRLLAARADRRGLNLAGGRITSLDRARACLRDLVGTVAAAAAEARATDERRAIISVRAFTATLKLHGALIATDTSCETIASRRVVGGQARPMLLLPDERPAARRRRGAGCVHHLRNDRRGGDIGAVSP